MHGFSFRLHSYYVSGEASLSKWKDADMDIQCIWLELILNVLRSVEYVGTVINWHTVHVLIDYKINFKSFICLCSQAYTYPHAHTDTHRHIQTYISKPWGHKIWHPGDRDLSFSSCLWGNLPSGMKSELPVSCSWILSEKIKGREPKKNRLYIPMCPEVYLWLLTITGPGAAFSRGC